MTPPEVQPGEVYRLSAHAPNEDKKRTKPNHTIGRKVRLIWHQQLFWPPLGGVSPDLYFRLHWDLLVCLARAGLSTPLLPGKGRKANSKRKTKTAESASRWRFSPLRHFRRLRAACSHSSVLAEAWTPAHEGFNFPPTRTLISEFERVAAANALPRKRHRRTHWCAIDQVPAPAARCGRETTRGPLLRVVGLAFASRLHFFFALSFGWRRWSVV